MSPGARLQNPMPKISEIIFYPIKSCRGIALQEAMLRPFGLSDGTVADRQWMLVDEGGEFLTQRAHPRMAVIAPRIGNGSLEVQATGMAPLKIPLALLDASSSRKVRIWRDTLDALDCGEAASAWFSEALGTRCRLVRFDSHVRRFSNTQWTGGIEAPNLFSDGYPFLVISQASLDDMNEKLAAQGRDALPMNRFRPNLVIDGIGAFEEDHAREIRIGDAVLKPVKPCPRCPIPSVNQATGIVGPDPLDILRTYRADPRVDGGITFGMNAILLKGEGASLRVGQEVEVELDF